MKTKSKLVLGLSILSAATLAAATTSTFAWFQVENGGVESNALQGTLTAASTQFSLDALTFTLSWTADGNAVSNGALPNVEPTDDTGAMKLIAADGKSLIPVTDANKVDFGMSALKLSSDVVVSVNTSPKIGNADATKSQIATYVGTYEVAVTASNLVKIGADWTAAKAAEGSGTLSFYIDIEDDGDIKVYKESAKTTDITSTGLAFTYGIIAQNTTAGTGGVYTPDTATTYENQTITVQIDND